MELKRAYLERLKLYGAKIHQCSSILLSQFVLRPETIDVIHLRIKYHPFNILLPYLNTNSFMNDIISGHVDVLWGLMQLQRG